MDLIDACKACPLLDLLSKFGLDSATILRAELFSPDFLQMQADIWQQEADDARQQRYLDNIRWQEEYGIKP